MAWDAPLYFQIEDYAVAELEWTMRNLMLNVMIWYEDILELYKSMDDYFDDDVFTPEVRSFDMWLEPVVAFDMTELLIYTYTEDQLEVNWPRNLGMCHP